MANYLAPVKNDSVVTVSTGYDTVATNIVLSSTHGSKLPQPSSDGTFYLVWINLTDYGSMPQNDPNLERVLVTSRSGDTLTVTRAQQGTTAKLHNVAGKTYVMYQSFDADFNSRVETKLNGLEEFGFRARLAADMTSVAINTDVAMPFATEDWDVSGEFNNGTGIFTATKPGKVIVIASAVVLNMAADKTAFLRLYKNGSLATQGRAQVSASGNCHVKHFDIQKLLLNDTLQMFIRHDDSVVRDVTSGAADTYFSVLGGGMASRV